MARLPDIPVQLFRQYQQTIFGEQADRVEAAESFKWGVDDALGQLPPDDGTDWEAEARRLEEEQQRRQEEQQRQIEEQARRDQEDYQRILDERAVAARANELARNAPSEGLNQTLNNNQNILPPDSALTYNDPTAGGTPQQPPSFADTADSLITGAFGPEPDAGVQDLGRRPPPERNIVPWPEHGQRLDLLPGGPNRAVPGRVDEFTTPEPGVPPESPDFRNRAVPGPGVDEIGGPDVWTPPARGVMTVPLAGQEDQSLSPAVVDATTGMTRSLIGNLTRPVPQPGTERPIQNPDGSVTTERSITVTDPDLNNGQPTNIPTVWGGQVVSDDEAVDNAIRSGRPWPSFTSIDEAETAAQQRSADLGAGRERSIGGTSLPYDAREADQGPHELIPERPRSFAEQAQDLITGAFGPESTIGSAASSAYGSAVRGGMPDYVGTARRGLDQGADIIDTYGAGKVAREIKEKADLERDLAAATGQPIVRPGGEEEQPWRAANPEQAARLDQLREEAGGLAAGASGTMGGGGLAGDAIAAIKALRAAGMGEAALNAERELAMKTTMTLEQIQKQTGAAIRALTEAAPEAPPTVSEPSAGPQPGDRVRLPDGIRATVLEGGGGGAPPSGRPPAPPGDVPPPPPSGGRQPGLPGFPEPPPEDTTHVRGFGILQGVAPEGREVLERAAERGRQFPRGVPQAAPDEAAVRLGMKPEEVAAKWHRQDTREAADEVAVLRQGVAAALDDVQAAARKARDGTLTAEDQQAAVDGIVDAAVGGEFLRAGRRAAESAGRALNQFRNAVSVQNARAIYDAMEAASNAARRTRTVLEGLKNGKAVNEAGLRQLEQTAASLEGAAGRDLLGEGGEAVRRRARRDAGLPEPPAGTPEAAAAGAPKEPSFAERWGQLKRAHTLAEESGDTARAADISDQISALSAEVRADAIDRAREAVAKTKKPLTLEEAQRIVDERLGQGPVSRIRREEMEQAKGFTAGKLQADLDRDVQKKVLAALRKAEAEQDALLKSLNIQTQRKIERAMALEKRADVKAEAKAMADQARAWMDRAKRDPSNMAFRDEFDQTLREMSEHSNVGEVMAADLREQFATHLDEHAFQFMSDVERRTADAERAAAAGERAGIQKEALQAMAQRLRDTVKAIHENPNRPGLLAEVDRLMADMTAVSQRGFEMSSDIKQSLTKAGLQRFAGKLSEDQVEQFTRMLRNIDPDDPRALGNIMAYMRRGHGLDRLREYSVMNMLSSTATSSPLGVNNIDNLLRTVAHYGFKLPGMAATESVRTLGGLRGTPELAWRDVGAAYKAAAGAFGPAMQDAVAIMRHGSTTRQAERAAQLADFGGVHPELMSERPGSLLDVAKGRWGPVGEFFHFLSTRQLEASDAFWSSVLESGNHAGLAARKARMSGGKLTAEQILANPLDHPDVLDQAAKMSRYTLLKAKGYGSRYLGGLISPGPDASLKRRLGALAAQHVIPFTTTPLNSVVQLMEFSPLGALYRGGEAALTKDGFARAELTNKALAGATLAGIGTAGIMSKVPNALGPEWTWITGAAPLDTEKRKALEARGWQANSAWNPTNRTYNSLMGTAMAPVLFPAWAMQGFADAVAKGERKGTPQEWDSWLAQALGGSALRTANSVIEQSMLRSVGDIVQGFSLQGDPSRLIAGWVSRYIPEGSLVAQLSRLGDAVQRDPKSVKERVQERTPFRGMLPERQGPLGEVQPNDMAGIMGLINPSPRRTTEHSNPTYQAFTQAGVDIGAPKSELALAPKISIQLTPDEQRRWQTLRGDLLQKAAPRMQDKPWWNKPMAREEAMQKILADAGEAADARLLKEIGAEDIRRRARGEAEKLRARARA